MAATLLRRERLVGRVLVVDCDVHQGDGTFYLAGADAWEHDRLGRLAVTKHGLRARDELVLDRVLEAGSAVAIVLAGGYAEDIDDTVDINLATVATAADRMRAPRPL